MDPQKKVYTCCSCCDEFFITYGEECPGDEGCSSFEGPASFIVNNGKLDNLTRANEILDARIKEMRRRKESTTNQ